MAAPLKLVQSIAFFCFLIGGQAQSQCSYRDILVTESRTGNFIQGKPQFHVVIRNNCACAQSGIQLDCTGFTSVDEIKPSILRRAGNVCILIQGRTLNQGDWAHFKYAADKQFWFNPISSDPSC
ncbi:hypothetical protein LUZ61_000956 [Rhynchospora tenuis]|uniref:Uncharacterized protein n=1 Tax=Rhynchospora tenuis TaxID=198213 RepID=A0AAD5ZGC2_9POAL|nr:hypothetical protein LUZ61_000956 [Rhynchospora tenuis]